MLAGRMMAMIAVAFCLFAGQASAQIGTWTNVATLAPHQNNGQMLLMTDGRIMCHTVAGGTLGDGTIWDILTPDSTGSYVNGTWSSTAGMTQERFSFSSEVLQSGNIYAAGGEYGTDGTQAGWHAETYNPTTNTWTEVTGTTSAKTISDGNCKLLDNGDVLQAEVNVSFPKNCMFFNPTTNAMTTAPSTREGDNESMWLKLPDGSVLFVDEDATTSERYIPATNTWIADGTVPVSLYDPYGYECGPAWMLPNGKAFFIGGTNKTAWYTPSGSTAPGTWSAGPLVPNSYGMPDAPGAMMRNGHILFACSPQPQSSTNEFLTPTVFYEFNYLDSTYTSVPSPTTDATGAVCQQFTMINLPNGQVMMSMDQDGAASAQYYIYTPGSAQLAAGQPIIDQVTKLTCNTFMAVGHRFNGISEGSAFGDENENDTNYPLFRFKSASGRIYYARSYNWNSTAVQRSLSVNDTAYFEIPATMVNGSYYMFAVANGIASDSILFVDSVASLNSPLTNNVCSGSLFTYTPTSGTAGSTFTWTRAAVTGISNAAITTAQTTNPSEILVNTTSAPVTVIYAYTITGGGCTNTENVSVTVNPTPTAGFTASPISSCILPDSVTFTNTSVAGTTYRWTFGDGGTSTASSPVHPYTATGSYTVKLVALSACGADSLTQSNYIAVTAPAAPAATSSAAQCGSGAFTLTASTTNNVAWYNSSGTFVSSANPFVTPVLTTTTTYYVDDSVPSPVDSVGPATYTTLGAGGNFANYNQHYLTFDALTNFTLVSVVVQASTAGARTIQLINSGGTVIATASPNIPIGVSTVTLNFSVPQGTGYELSCGGTGTVDIELYRNNAVAAGAYPFTLPGVVSITGNDVSTGYYYYFYNWKVQTAPCVSARTLVTATVYPAVTATTSPTAVSCNGGTNGIASVNVTTGTPTYSYNWSGGHSGNPVTGLTAGTYTVTITDAHSCSTILSETLTQPTALSVTGTVTNASCSANSGSIIASVTGGTTGISGYTYLWNTTPQQTSDTAKNLGAGTYTVTVTDANSCTTTKTFTVTGGTGSISLGTSTVSATCGNANGTATVTVTPAGTYTYGWSAGTATTSATDLGLAAGTYTVTVTSGACSATASASVASTSISLSSSSTPTTCGLNNGTATATITNPVNPTYTWSGGVGTTATVSSLPSGTYTVTATSNGCSATASVSVTASTGISETTSSTATTCGLNNGTATVTITNPVNPTYIWSGAAGTTATVTGLASGTYTVTVHNNGCSATATTTVGASTGVTESTSSTATTCGLNNGTATVTITNPVNPTYTWSGAAGTTATVTGLASGTYTVTVNSNGCSATATTSVAASTGVTESTSSTATTCGLNNGTATVTITNPVNPTYTWSGTAGTTATVTGLASGTYTVTVHSNGCSATATTSVAASTGVSEATSATATTCGQNNGTATVTITNPVNPTYTWSGNAGTTATVTGLASGTYTVTVHSNGCSATATTSVAASTGVSLSTSSTNATCGSSNGTATVTVTNPVNPTYSWSGGGGTAATATGLAAGSYTVTVHSNGCSATASASVSSTGGPTVSSTEVGTTCGNSNGSAHAIVNSGSGPFTYLWNNSLTDSVITGLASGTYTVTVKDVNGCASISTVTVAASTGVSESISSIPTTCGLNNGGATVTISNPVNPTYNWSGGAGTGASISGVASGTYTVTVNSNGCSATASVSVAASTGVSLSTSSTPTSCGQTNGSASVTITNPVNPTYNWSGGAGTTASISGVASGTYTVTVNSNGCSATASVSVASSGAPSLTTSSVSTSCGGNNGSATVTVTNPNNPTYVWSGGVGTTATVTGLAAGSYTVTVTNGAGCTASATVSVGSSGAPSVTTSTIDAVCAAANGSALVTVTNPNNPTYIWSGGHGTADSISGVAPGTYTVTVTNGGNCSVVVSVTVGQSSGTLAVSPNPTAEPCYGEALGTAAVNVTGGTPTYGYSWSTNQNTSSVTGLTAGTYTVTVSDVSGCSVIAAVTITQPDALGTVITVNQPGGGPTTGSAIIDSVTGGTKPFMINWSNGRTGDSSGTLAVGTYTVQVTDSNRCKVTDTVVIRYPAGISNISGGVSFSIYPNPAKTEVTIDLQNIYDNATISITDMIGETLVRRELTASSTTLDLTPYASGVYFIEIAQGGKTAVRKLVINK
jgi:PKD repeat protein